MPDAPDHDPFDCDDEDCPCQARLRCLLTHVLHKPEEN